jgi:hypothetical protein
VWLPDLFITNSAEEDSIFLETTKEYYALVHNNGKVTIVYPMFSMSTRCSLGVKNFPFEQQECGIGLSSWAVSEDKLDLEIGNVSISTDFYTTNSVWDLMDTSYYYNYTHDRYSFDFPNYNIKEINFMFTIKRRPLYFMITSIFPCLVLNLLTLMSFFLPSVPQFTISKPSIA